MEPFADLFSKAVQAAGGSETKLAEACGYSQNAIWSAKRAGRVSAEMAVKIETATGIDRWRFRPDLWSAPSASVEAIA